MIGEDWIVIQEGTLLLKLLHGKDAKYIGIYTFIEDSIAHFLALGDLELVRAVLRAVVVGGLALLLLAFSVAFSLSFSFALIIIMVGITAVVMCGYSGSPRCPGWASRWACRGWGAFL